MKILIGADFVPTESNLKLFAEPDVETLVGKEFLALLSDVDYRIFNLEMPLTDNGRKISKCGPNLRAPVSAIAAYKVLAIDLLTLANNHIMDYGVEGLRSTIRTLADNDIGFVGAGETLSEARKPYYIGKSNVVIYACTEQEFSVADNKHPGANPFDPLEIFDDIERINNGSNYIIVLYHGGKEQYRYPSPNLQKRCRKFIEKGADLVVCQHSHCIGCREKYRTGEIVYGQGNALFDLNDNEYWNSGLLVVVDSEKNAVDYVPVKKNGFGVCIAEKEEMFLDAFYARSEQILDDNFVHEEYRRYAQSFKQNYYKCFLGVGDWFLYRVFNKLIQGKLDYILAKRFASKRRLLNWKNLIQCEAHNELLMQAINDDIICKES